MNEKTDYHSNQQEMRSGWQVLLFFLLTLFLILLMGSLAFIAIHFTPLAAGSRDADQLHREIIWLWEQVIDRGASLAGVLISSAICLKLLAHRKFVSLGYCWHRGWARDFVIGVGGGGLMISLVALIERLGGAQFIWQPHPLSQAISTLGLMALMLLIAASLEEALFRGFPLQALAKNLHPAWAALIMSVPFGLIHLSNPNASFFSTLNTIFAGVWLCAAYFKTRSLWLPTGLHLGWNFTLGSVYGIPVSGVTDLSQYSLWQIYDRAPAWLSGGSYGSEGGAAATIVLALATLCLIYAKWPNVSIEMARYFPQAQAKSAMEAAGQPDQISTDNQIKE
jgi:membrane protease YdiL (CAAX protease family)